MSESHQCTAPLNQSLEFGGGLDVGFSSCTVLTYYYSVQVFHAGVQSLESRGKSGRESLFPSVKQGLTYKVQSLVSGD